jgi:YD repeat-containing protein
LKSQSTHKSNSDKISEEIYTYSSLTSPVTQKSWGYHWYIASYNLCGASGYNGFAGTYRAEIENYRASQVVRKDFDQNNQSNFIQNTVDYTYAGNKRLIKTTTSTNSKGNSLSKTFYYPEDMDQAGNGIPMLTGIDQASINNMVGSNRTNVLIHTADNNNGAITQLHNTYETFNLGTYNNVYLTSVAAYKGTTLIRQQFMKYDLVTSNLISTNETGGKYSSFLYGYNSSYPVAKATNVSSSSTATLQSGTTYGGYFYLAGSASFTTTISGSIVLNLSFGSYPGSNNLTNAYYTITGASNASGTLCFSMTGSGCGGNSSSVTIPNMPAGTYSLSAYASTNYPSSNPFLSYSYATLTPTFTYTKEFFYQGFEEGNATNSGNAHTGNGYYTGNYSVNFALPNSRSYVMQWWNLVNGVWIFNEQQYTGPVNLTGSVDDIRVFPSDAQMSSFSYNPLVGVTGETDPSGRTVTSEYDGFSRLNITRDNDKNILKKICYSYAGQTIGCALFTNAMQSGDFTRNDCSPGTGTTETYIVPVGKYYSEISQADADQQAINDLNTNGQDYANTHGQCINSNVNVVVNNYTGAYLTITLTNSSNYNDVYYFYVFGYQTNYTIGTVPIGNYDIVIDPVYNPYDWFWYDINGYYQSGSGYQSWYYMGLYCTNCCTINISN